MFIEYKNSLGRVLMSGGSGSEIRITETDGLGLVERQYTTVYFAGQDGQETVGSKALPRCITLGLEVCHKEAQQRVRSLLRILSQPGYLILGERRIYCNQTSVPDPARVLRGKIATLGVQFICDRPYFEDAKSTVCSIYRRTKELTSPFSLPTVFGRTYSEAELVNLGDIATEPVLRIVCPRALDEAETLTVSNLTTGKSIALEFTPGEGEEILIDIPNRNLWGSIGGNMLNALTDETFLGDFVLVPGVNRIKATVGDAASGFVVECTYSNLYNEAVIV